MYRASGEVVRSALVVTTGNDDIKLRSLARFIADGTPSQELDRITGVTARPAPLTAEKPIPLGAKLCLGAGIAGVVGGVTLIAASPGPDPNKRYYYRTTPPGIGIGLAGLASIGIGLWWWRHERRASSAPTVSFGSSHAVVGWTGSF